MICEDSATYRITKPECHETEIEKHRVPREEGIKSQRLQSLRQVKYQKESRRC